MGHTNEQAISGKTSGQISLGETVEWKARHFGLYFRMTIKITEFQKPLQFTDEMIKGPFKYLRHQHRFEKTNSGTLMTDSFEFQSPLGILGTVADKLFLERYMRKLLLTRNLFIKEKAEYDVS